MHKTILVLDETELFQALREKPGLLEKAIRQGKGFKRAERVRRYEADSNTEKE